MNIINENKISEDLNPERVGNRIYTEKVEFIESTDRKCSQCGNGLQ